MGIAWRGGTGADAGSVSTTYLDLTSCTGGTGSLLIAGVRKGSQTGTTTCADDKLNEYATDINLAALADTNTFSLFSAPNTSSGTIRITVTLNTTATCRWFVMEATGAATSSVFDANGDAYTEYASPGTDTPITDWSSGASGTLSQANNLVVGIVVGNATAPTWSAGTTGGFTFRTQHGKIAYETKVVSSTDAVTAYFNSTDNGGSEYGEVIVATYKEAASGTAHPYTGIIQGVIETGGVRTRGVNRIGEIQGIIQSGSVWGRGKKLDGIAELIGAVEASKSKGKIYQGDASYVVEVIAEKARGKGITGDARLVAQSAYDIARGRGYDGTTQLILEVLAGAAYSPGAGTAKSYIGTVQIIGEAGSVTARGRAYYGSGQLIIVTEAAASSSLTAPTAWRYNGLSQGVIQSTAQHTRIYKRVYVGTVNLVIEVDGRYVSTIVPFSRWTLEPKPHDGYVKEALPTRPAGIDGAWTTDEDGAVTEPPVDGAYTSIGYYKEWKPWWKSYTKEGKPN